MREPIIGNAEPMTPAERAARTALDGLAVILANREVQADAPDVQLAVADTYNRILGMFPDMLWKCDPTIEGSVIEV